MPCVVVNSPTQHERSEPLLHACRDRPQAVVDLSWRLSENQADDGLPGDSRVLEGPKNVDLGVGEHYSRPRRILDGVPGLAVLASDTADGAGEMVTLKCLDVLEKGGSLMSVSDNGCRVGEWQEEGGMATYFNLERLNVEIIHPEQGDSVVDVEAQGKGTHEVGALLDRAVICGDLGGAQLDALALHVHAALELEVLDQRRVDLGPRGLERRHAVGRDGDLAVLDADGPAPGRGRGEARAALLVHGVVELHLCLGLLGLV